MSFFKKMKERLFKSQSKLDEGLDALMEEGEEVVEAPSPTPAAITSPEPSDLTAPDPGPGPAPSSGEAKPGMLGRALGALTGGRRVRKRVLDDEMLEELEELLITADMGVETSLKVSAALAEGRFGRAVDADEIKHALAAEVAKILKPVARPLPSHHAARKPRCGHPRSAGRCRRDHATGSRRPR